MQTEFSLELEILRIGQSRLSVQTPVYLYSNKIQHQKKKHKKFAISRYLIAKYVVFSSDSFVIVFVQILKKSIRIARARELVPISHPTTHSLFIFIYILFQFYIEFSDLNACIAVFQCFTFNWMCTHSRSIPLEVQKSEKKKLNDANELMTEKSDEF